MDTLIKSTLLSSISAGGRIKAPRQPNIWCGSADNGYTPGDLVDANGLVEFIIENDILHDDPEFNSLKDQLEQEQADRETAIAQLTKYVNSKIEEIVGLDTPEALDTLKEIADALGNDPEVITKLTQRITAAETALNSKKDKQTAFAYTTSGETDRIITGIIQDENGAITITSNVAYNANRQKHGLMSSDHYIKLEGISAGAEVNVQSDWNETDSSSDAYIQNKPDLSVYALGSDVEADKRVIASSLTDLDGRIIELNQVVEDNELVTSAALNDLNSAIDSLGTTVNTIDTTVDDLGTTVEGLDSRTPDTDAVAAALVDLDSRIYILDERVDDILSDYIPILHNLNEQHIKDGIRSRELAQPGDIVLTATISGVENTIFMSLDAYNKYGSGDYTPVAIVVKPYDPDEDKVICMATRFGSLRNPEQGSNNAVDMYWGGHNVENTMTNYDSSFFYLPSNYYEHIANPIDKGTYWCINADTDNIKHVSPYVSGNIIAQVQLAANDPCNDTDGVSNTTYLASITTATHTAGGTITNSYAAGNYPANDSCRYYNAAGKSWYLPSMGELQYIVPRFKEINSSFSKFSSTLVGHYFWSSTQSSKTVAWRLGLRENYFGDVGSDTKGTNDSVVPFAAF